MPFSEPGGFYRLRLASILARKWNVSGLFAHWRQALRKCDLKTRNGAEKFLRDHITSGGVSLLSRSHGCRRAPFFRRGGALRRNFHPVASIRLGLVQPLIGQPHDLVFAIFCACGAGKADADGNRANDRAAHPTTKRGFQFVRINQSKQATKRVVGRNRPPTPPSPDVITPER